MALWPKLPEVRSYLRMQPDPGEDAIITTALAAAFLLLTLLLGEAGEALGAWLRP